MGRCTDIQKFGKLYLESQLSSVDHVNEVTCITETNTRIVLETDNGYSKSMDEKIEDVDFFELVTKAPYGDEEVKIRVKRFKIPDRLLEEVEEIHHGVNLDINNSLI